MHKPTPKLVTNMMKAFRFKFSQKYQKSKKGLSLVLKLDKYRLLAVPRSKACVLLFYKPQANTVMHTQSRVLCSDYAVHKLA